MAILAIGAIGVALLAALLFSRTLTRPLQEMVDNLQEIAQGEADLSHTLEVRSQDELGALAGNFNAFVGTAARNWWSESAQPLRIFSAPPSRFARLPRTSAPARSRQATSLEDSFQAIQGIDESAVDVANGISSLLDAVEISSSATLELGATIEEIVSQVERLFTNIEDDFQLDHRDVGIEPAGCRQPRESLLVDRSHGVLDHPDGCLDQGSRGNRAADQPAVRAGQPGRRERQGRRGRDPGRHPDHSEHGRGSRSRHRRSRPAVARNRQHPYRDRRGGGPDPPALPECVDHRRPGR